MPRAGVEEKPVNLPQPVNWFLANYYPTNEPGQTADVIGQIFQDYNSAVDWGRNKLATENVGMVLIVPCTGFAMFPLFDPEPS